MRQFRRQRITWLQVVIDIEKVVPSLFNICIVVNFGFCTSQFCRLTRNPQIRHAPDKLIFFYWDPFGRPGWAEEQFYEIADNSTTVPVHASGCVPTHWPFCTNTLRTDDLLWRFFGSWSSCSTMPDKCPATGRCGSGFCVCPSPNQLYWALSVLCWWLGRVERCTWRMGSRANAAPRDPMGILQHLGSNSDSISYVLAGGGDVDRARNHLRPSPVRRIVKDILYVWRIWHGPKYSNPRMLPPCVG